MLALIPPRGQQKTKNSLRKPQKNVSELTNFQQSSGVMGIRKSRESCDLVVDSKSIHAVHYNT